MAPGTTIGAAHPVGEGGSEIKGVVGKKIENFTASFAGSIARERGRNEQWVEQAVRESAAISEAEALKRHVIDIVAPDLRSLLVQASGREVKVNGGRTTVKLELAGAAIHRLRMTMGQALLNVLADPNIVYLLMLAGIVGIYFEFGHPGFYLPGVVGAICLLLALGSFEILPINLTGLLLLMLGIGMLVAEVFVTSYGVLGIGGVIAFVIGSLFLIDSSQTNLEVNRGMIAGAAIAMSAIILGLGWVVFTRAASACRRPAAKEWSAKSARCARRSRRARRAGCSCTANIGARQADQALGVGARRGSSRCAGWRSRCAANRNAAFVQNLRKAAGDGARYEKEAYGTGNRSNHRDRRADPAERTQGAQRVRARGGLSPRPAHSVSRAGRDFRYPDPRARGADRSAGRDARHRAPGRDHPRQRHR